MSTQKTVSAARFYSIVAATGAVIMALEILSSRVLAPFFGNSVYVWGSIISVFLAALSIGYFWGGRLADREPRLALLGRLLAIAAAFLVLLLAFGTRLAGAVAAATGYSPAGTLVATTLLFGPPSVLLATVSPFAIRLATRDLAYLGDTAGKLFALSTAGSLFGTLTCTFVLIPYLESRQIFGLLLLATAITAVVALLDELRREKLAATAAGLAALAALTVFVGWGSAGGANGSGTLLTRLTAYQALEVTEEGGIRFLRGDRALQSAVRVADQQPALDYQRWQAAALLLNPEIDSLLVLGMGAGISGPLPAAGAARPGRRLRRHRSRHPRDRRAFLLLQAGAAGAHPCRRRAAFPDRHRAALGLHLQRRLHRPGSAVPSDDGGVLRPRSATPQPRRRPGDQPRRQHGGTVCPRHVSHRGRPLRRRTGLRCARQRQHPGAGLDRADDDATRTDDRTRSRA